MRRLSTFLAAACVCLVGSAAAQAQTSAAPAPARKYVLFTFGPTFGHKNDVSLGAEFGIPIRERLDLFVDAGRMRNYGTLDHDAAADVIARYISGATTTKEPISFFDVGVRHVIPTTGRAKPYVLVGLGVANVKRETTFTVGGTDVTGQLLDRYGVQLGGDLSGTETKAQVVLGLGAHVGLTSRWIADASYRFGRIFLSGQGRNTNRLQFGIGARF